MVLAPDPPAPDDPGQPSLEIVEYTDPFCPWAWGTEPKLRRLRLALGGQARWRRVFGILVAGSGPPVATSTQLERWSEVSRHTGAPLPDRLEWPVSSSWPVSRTAKAAERQGPEVAERVLRRLREATFLFGRPPVGDPSIAEAVDGVPGLDLPRLIAESHGAEVERALAADWEETRTPLAAVIDLVGPPPHPGAAVAEGERVRYRFPTIVARSRAGAEVVPGWRPFVVYDEAIARVAPGLGLGNGLLESADQALSLFDSLTIVDLEELIGRPEPPTTGRRLETGTGPIWLRQARRGRSLERSTGDADASQPGLSAVSEAR